MTGPALNILYEDNHVVVAVKPENLPSQADESGDADMLSLVREYVRVKYSKPGEAYIGLVHRLDRPVGGVMVFARTSKAAARLSSQFAGSGAHKRYAAIVCGHAPYGAELSDWLVRDGDNFSRIAAQDAPGAKSARLSFSRIAEREGLSLLDVELHTGRHHQIRAQLKNAGLPIWGDRRYNPAAVPGQQIALWAYSLSFEHPTRHERMTFCALPDSGIWRDFTFELDCMLEGVRIAYIDGNIVAIDKPAGLPVAEADAPSQDTAETRLDRLLGRVFPVHRLDVNTTGLTLFARSMDAELALGEAMLERTLKKYYRCTVLGSPPAHAELVDYGIKDDAQARLYVYDTPAGGAKELRLAYDLISQNGETAELSVLLLTGRTHQIRAQLAHAGLPILGDDKYGDREANRRHGTQLPALRAVRLELYGLGAPLEYLNGRVISLEEA